MYEGLKRMEARVQVLNQGGKVPILGRGRPKVEHIITGFASTEFYTYEAPDDVTGIVTDREGTLYRSAVLRKPLNATQWEEYD